MSDDAIADWQAGRVSAEVALARLILAGTDPGATPLAPEAARYTASLARLARMVAEADVSHLGSDDSPVDPVAQVRTMFDRASGVSPEGSVAAYSLGDPALLQAATEELLAWLAGENVLRGDSDVLDVGSGIGRVAVAIAPHVRSVVGLDVSPAMTRLATERVTAANVTFATADGRDLATIDDASIDLVLAVDSFPYVVMAGLGPAMLAEFARVLRPMGVAVLFNFAYGGDVDLNAWAAAAGLAVTLDGAQPFTLWDARVFRLKHMPSGPR